MESIKSKCLGLALAGFLAVSTTPGTNDVWLTSKARVALLSADGVVVRDINVEAEHGAVTLHGKVRTEAEKDKAAAAVRGIAGVTSVRNLLQVVSSAANTVKK